MKFEVFYNVAGEDFSIGYEDSSDAIMINADFSEVEAGEQEIPSAFWSFPSMKKMSEDLPAFFSFLNKIEAGDIIEHDTRGFRKSTDDGIRLFYNPSCKECYCVEREGTPIYIGDNFTLALKTFRAGAILNSRLSGVTI